MFSDVCHVRGLAVTLIQRQNFYVNWYMYTETDISSYMYNNYFCVQFMLRISSCMLRCYLFCPLPYLYLHNVALYRKVVKLHTVYHGDGGKGIVCVSCAVSPVFVCDMFNTIVFLIGELSLAIGDLEFSALLTC